MSPNVGNFVHDLVEMAKAMETLPQVQAELDNAKEGIEQLSKTVQMRELAIIDYKQEIETLHAKVRSLEVERDDASFRVLEAEDNANVVLANVSSALTILETAYAKLNPPKPEPVKEPEPIIDHAAEKLAAEPFPPQAQPVPEAVHSIEDTTQGQSESSPTVNTGETQDNAGQSPAKSMDAGSTTMETSSAEPSHGPYFGKRYRDVSGYVNIHDWITGGGTEADYYSAPSQY